MSENAIGTLVTLIVGLACSKAEIDWAMWSFVAGSAAAQLAKVIVTGPDGELVDFGAAPWDCAQAATRSSAIASPPSRSQIRSKPRVLVKAAPSSPSSRSSSTQSSGTRHY